MRVSFNDSPLSRLFFELSKDIQETGESIHLELRKLYDPCNVDYYVYIDDGTNIEPLLPNTIGIRIGEVYYSDPEIDKRSLLVDLISGEEIKVGDKLQHNYTYLPDAVEAIVFVLRNLSQFECGQIYNAMNPEVNSEFEFARELQKYRPDIKFEVDSSDYIEPFVYDTYLPTIPIKYRSIREGLDDLFRFDEKE